MSRTALARRYRPHRFAELSRQEHVAETLKSAVARGRVAHAYLFAGPRGVGKTTAARVLAMALNCPDRAEDGEPCGVCDSCQRIWSGRTSLDVVEIDAASNRGVDDARDLRERAMYAPTDEQRYKVYIIDEAHMLTREAWNALLKILEEPPPRVIFVFATTEPQKIQQAAPPILSRCQRFDFRRIGVPAIVDRLQEVVDRETVRADREALVLIARRAEGGLRDALSLLDQVMAVVDDRLSADEVRRLLGLVDEERYVELFDILAEHRHGDVFRFVERLLDEGYDLVEFYRGLADAIRLRLTVRFDGPAAAEDAAVRDDLRPVVTAQAERFATGDLLRMLTQVAELDADGRFRKSGNPRVLLETLLLRFAHLDRTVELEDIVRSLSGAGPAAAAAAAAPPAPGSTAPPAARKPAARKPATPAPAEGAPAPRPDDAPPGPTSPGDEARPDAGPVALAAPPRPTPAAALEAVLAARDVLPVGLFAFMKAARLEEPRSGELRLAVPAGPALERLRDDVARLALQRALGEQLGREVSLEVVDLGAAGGGGVVAERLTPEKIRSDRLARLAREEPVLGRAVEAWDLELLD